MAACGTSDQTSESTSETETKEAVSGGWEIYDNEANVLPEDVQASFDKALETFTGSELKPVAYVASQVVAGTNYMILCEAATTTQQPETTYQMVIVYADLLAHRLLREQITLFSASVRCRQKRRSTVFRS